MRSGGIRAAAAVTGHYEATVSANPENNVESLAQLVAWHDLVVVGRVGANRGWVTDDGDDVVTDYRVQVESVLKGRPVHEITVSVLGGRVSFDDGTTATLTSTMPPPRPGQRYVLFLVPSDYPSSALERRQAAGGGTWMLQHLSLGVFLLDPERGVIPRARPGHPLQDTLHGMEERDFVDAIRALARRRS